MADAPPTVTHELRVPPCFAVAPRVSNPAAAWRRRAATASGVALSSRPFRRSVSVFRASRSVSCRVWANRSASAAASGSGPPLGERGVVLFRPQRIGWCRTAVRPPVVELPVTTT